MPGNVPCCRIFVSLLPSRSSANSRIRPRRSLHCHVRDWVRLTIHHRLELVKLAGVGELPRMVLEVAISKHVLDVLQCVQSFLAKNTNIQISPQAEGRGWSPSSPVAAGKSVLPFNTENWQFLDIKFVFPVTISLLTASWTSRLWSFNLSPTGRMALSLHRYFGSV